MKRYTTYVNGKIYTDLRHSNKVECLVTDLKKVVFAGDLAKARREFDAQEFDLHGHTLYPAFQDAHGHLTDLGRSLSYPDLNACKSEDEMLLVMKNNASSFDSKQWMIGRGWDQNKWNIKELPDNTKLNALFPDIPVMLVRTDSHAALLNQTALNLSEHAWKPYSDSAHVLKNEKGMSGLLMDEAYYSVLPISAESIQVKRKLISTASDFLISKGITSIGDAWWTAEDRQLFLNLNDDQDLKIRIYGMTKIDKWFLEQIHELIIVENQIKNEDVLSNKEKLQYIKSLGFSDKKIAKILKIKSEDVRAARNKFDPCHSPCRFGSQSRPGFAVFTQSSNLGLI